MPSLLFTKHEAQAIQAGNHNLRLEIQSIAKMRASKTFYMEENVSSVSLSQMDRHV